MSQSSTRNACTDVLLYGAVHVLFPSLLRGRRPFVIANRPQNHCAIENNVRAWAFVGVMRLRWENETERSAFSEQPHALCSAVPRVR